MVLAAGQAIAGHPWVGVWLSCSIMCAALCWMLQGWLPPAWAFLGGIVCALKLGIISYWATSYWGGAVAALGGLLVLGALPRILKRAKLIHGILLGAGISILAASRPCEGFVLYLPVMLVLLIWFFRRKGPGRLAKAVRIVFPAGAVFIAAAYCLVFYNWAVTGDPLRLPYQAYMDQYFQSVPFVWVPPASNPSFNNPQQMGHWVSDEVGMSERIKTPVRYLAEMPRHARGILRYFLGGAFLIPLLALPWALFDRRIRLLAFIALFVAAGTLIEKPYIVHYAAPALGLIYALMFQSLRRLSHWRLRGRAAGRMLARGTIGIAVAFFTLRLLLAICGWHDIEQNVIASDAEWSYERARIIEKLEKTGQKHLIVVRYKPGHNIHNEWVYNRADIDAATVVWARELSEESNNKLFNYFEDRRIWIVEADETPPQLRPYRPD